MLDEKRARGEIPSGIREQFLEDLLSQLRCICGRPLEEGGPEYRRLEELLHKAVPSEVENLILDTASQAKVLLQTRPLLSSDLAELLHQRSDLESDMESLYVQLDEISRKLQNSPVEEVGALERKRVAYQEQIESLNHEIGHLNGRAEELTKVLQDYQDKITKQEAQEEKAAKLQLRATLARRAADAVQNTLGAFAEQVRQSIEDKAKQIFDRLIWKQSQFTDIRISREYRLDVIDRWGMPARPELSMGERQVLSLSFIAAMAEEAGEEAPLVMDTPFGRLSRAHRESITKSLPDLAPQIVLFVQDEELRDQARENLLPRIGAEWFLKFDVATGCTQTEPLTATPVQGV